MEPRRITADILHAFLKVQLTSLPSSRMSYLNILVALGILLARTLQGAIPEGHDADCHAVRPQGVERRGGRQVAPSVLLRGLLQGRRLRSPRGRQHCSIMILVAVAMEMEANME